MNREEFIKNVNKHWVKCDTMDDIRAIILCHESAIEQLLPSEKDTSSVSSFFTKVTEWEDGFCNHIGGECINCKKEKDTSSVSSLSPQEKEWKKYDRGECEDCNMWQPTDGCVLPVCKLDDSNVSEHPPVGVALAQDCPDCDGNGIDYDYLKPPHPFKCNTCKGTGKRVDIDLTKPEWDDVIDELSRDDCDGKDIFTDITDSKFSEGKEEVQEDWPFKDIKKTSELIKEREEDKDKVNCRNCPDGECNCDKPDYKDKYEQYLKIVCECGSVFVKGDFEAKEIPRYVKELKDKYEQIKSDNEDNIQECIDVQIELKKVKKENEQIKAELDECRCLSDDREENMIKLVSEIEELKKENEKLERQIKYYKGVSNRFEKENDSILIENLAYEMRIKQLEKEKEQLKECRNEEDSHYKEWVIEKIDSLKEKNSQLTSDYNYISDNFVDCSKICLKLECENEVWKKRWDELNEKYEQLNDRQWYVGSKQLLKVTKDEIEKEHPLGE